MSVVDTSVLTAILLNEPEAKMFVDYLEGTTAFVPASVLVEAAMVAISRGKKGALDTLVSPSGMVETPRLQAKHDVV